jgi:hypothetical protein
MSPSDRFRHSCVLCHWSSLAAPRLLQLCFQLGQLLPLLPALAHVQPGNLHCMQHQLQQHQQPNAHTSRC